MGGSTAWTAMVGAIDAAHPRIQDAKVVRSPLDMYAYVDQAKYQNQCGRQLKICEGVAFWKRSGRTRIMCSNYVFRMSWHMQAGGLRGMPEVRFPKCTSGDSTAAFVARWRIL